MRRAGLSLAKRPECDAEISLCHRPFECHALARPLLQSGAEDRNRLLEMRRVGLSLTKRPERDAEIGLRGGPANPIARPNFQRRAVARDRLHEMRRARLSRAKCQERVAEIVLCPRPVERRPITRQFLQRRVEGRDGLLEMRRPALAFPERRQRIAKVVLRPRPHERHPIAPPQAATSRRLYNLPALVVMPAAYHAPERIASSPILQSVTPVLPLGLAAVSGLGRDCGRTHS